MFPRLSLSLCPFCTLHSDLSLLGWLSWPESDTAPLMSDKPFSPSTILFCAEICLRWKTSQFVNKREPCLRPDSLSHRGAFALQGWAGGSPTGQRFPAQCRTVLASRTGSLMGRKAGRWKGDVDMGFQLNQRPGKKNHVYSVSPLLFK